MRFRPMAFAGVAAFAVLAIFACSSDDDPPGSGSDLGPDASGGRDSSTGNDATVDQPDTGTITDAGTDSSVSPCIVVAKTGLDSNAGTSAAPFLTITHALSVLAAAGDAGAGCVQVMPGTYSMGETFPLVIPAGTSLLGDEVAKGDGATPTKVTTDFDGGAFPYQELVDPQAGSTLAGFTLHVTGGDYVAAVHVTKDHVTIRNNSFVDNVVGNAIRFQGGNDGIVQGNIITGTTNKGFSAAINFRPPSKRNRVEGNVIARNEYGLEFDDKDTNDFGGGDAGSVGGNELRCNSKNDVWTNAVSTFFGVNNRWDHFPPTLGLQANGTDIRNGAGGGATFYVDGGSIAEAGCP
jgi:hypothetical protein